MDSNINCNFSCSFFCFGDNYFQADKSYLGYVQFKCRYDQQHVEQCYEYRTDPCSDCNCGYNFSIYIYKERF